MKDILTFSGITRGQTLKAIVLGAAALSLTGCGGGVQQALGIGKDAPDEFAIVTKAPLVIPPDFSLRPPQPGAPSPQVATPSEQAQVMMFGDAGLDGTPLTSGESALMEQAGAAQVDPNIRAVVDQESAALVQKDDGFFSDVMSIGGSSVPEDEVLVNPAAEQQRLETDPTAATPVIVPDDGGWFNWF